MTTLPGKRRISARLLADTSLRTRAMLLATLALTVILLTDTVLRETTLARDGRLALEQRAALLASIQADALSVPMWNLDRDQVAAALAALSADPDFVAASVIDADGSVLEQRSAHPAPSPGLAPIIAVTKDITYARAGQNRVIGSLHVKLSGARLNQQLSRDRQHEAASLVFLLSLILLILFVTLRQFTRSLDLLAGALTRLAAGDRNTPIPASDQDNEVGAVARALQVFRDTAFRLVEAEGAYRAVFDNAPIGIFTTDVEARLESANPAALRISGYASQEELFEALRRDDGTGFYVQPGLRAELFRLMREEGGFSARTQQIRRADGSTAWISVTGRAVLDETGRLLRYTGTIEDVTDRLRLREEERLRVRAAMESASDAILIVDGQGVALFANPAFEGCFGFGPERLAQAGGLPSLLADPAQSASLSLALQNGESWQAEAEVFSGDGSKLPLLMRVNSIRDGTGAGFGAVVICTDLSDRRRAEERIQHMAHYDWLTGLPNRVLFRERLAQALAQVGQHGGNFAVHCMDLDRFKVVNDTLGHAAGDRLLQLAAARLQSSVREGDTVARVGGDEFTVIQLGISNVDQAVLLAGRLIDELAQVFDLDGREAQIGACIGIAMAPMHGTDADRLLGFADVALYEAKMQGRRRMLVFTPDMDRMLRQRTELERDLRLAVAEGRLFLKYQPQYRLAGETVVGAEALLRWSEPGRGEVSPADFMPIAEDSGLIHAIGDFVLQSACREAASWPDGLRVAVNVSPAQFHGADLIGKVRRILGETGLDGSRLELEITEGVLLRDTEATRATLLGLKALGVRITLDDFGTGTSSLGCLQRMPFDKIKIDRSFVAGIGHDPTALALIRSIIGLAKGLGLETNAEGVETPLQARLLREEGCQEVQGFYFSHPAPAAEFARAQHAKRAIGLVRSA